MRIPPYALLMRRRKGKSWISFHRSQSPLLPLLRFTPGNDVLPTVRKLYQCPFRVTDCLQIAVWYCQARWLVGWKIVALSFLSKWLKHGVEFWTRMNHFNWKKLTVYSKSHWYQFWCYFFRNSAEIITQLKNIYLRLLVPSWANISAAFWILSGETRHFLHIMRSTTVITWLYIIYCRSLHLYVVS